MKAHSELELIARRYRKYGVSLDKLLDLTLKAMQAEEDAIEEAVRSI